MFWSWIFFSSDSTVPVETSRLQDFQLSRRGSSRNSTRFRPLNSESTEDLFASAKFGRPSTRSRLSSKLSQSLKVWTNATFLVHVMNIWGSRATELGKMRPAQIVISLKWSGISTTSWIWKDRELHHQILIQVSWNVALFSDRSLRLLLADGTYVYASK